MKIGNPFEIICDSCRYKRKIKNKKCINCKFNPHLRDNYRPTVTEKNRVEWIISGNKRNGMSATPDVKELMEDIFNFEKIFKEEVTDE